MSRLSQADKREIGEYLLITSRYLRQMADSDALQVRMSKSAVDRLREYARNADTLRRKLLGGKES